MLPDWPHAQAHASLTGDALATAMLDRRQRVASTLSEGGGRSLDGSGETVAAAFTDAVAAIEAGLAAVRAGASVGMALGPVYHAGDYAFGASLSAARRLAGLRQHDLSLALPGSEAVAVPEGVGSFRAPEHRESAAGVPMLVLSDYRQPA